MMAAWTSSVVKDRLSEERNEAKVSRSVLESSGSCKRVADFNPIRDLQGFDSLLCIEAIGMLADKLDVEIPNGNNFFLSKDGKRWLTIDESVAVVCEIVHRGET
jgi:acyl carrier protein